MSTVPPAHAPGSRSSSASSATAASRSPSSRAIYACLVDHRPPRPRAALARRASSSASTAARGRCAGRRAADGDPAHRLGAARGASAAAPRRRSPRTPRARSRSGSTIFLDSSSSCLALARQLVSEPADRADAGHELARDRLRAASTSAILVIVTPGELDQHMRLLAGRWTTDFLSGLNFELAFCSCAGVTLDAGLTTSRRALADVINVAQRERGAHDRADRLEQVRARRRC